MLGAEIVAEPVACPAQRFHSECWQTLCGATGERERGERPAAPRRIGTIEEGEACAVGGAGASGGSGAERADGGIVSGYADAWRREGLQDHRASRAYRNPRPALPRSSVLDGLISYDDGATGEKRIARGFSSAELDTVTARWAAGVVVDAAEECAICVSAVSRGLLRLPCGHSFCGECVVPWLRKCALCPMCRGDLRLLLDRETSGGAMPGASLPQTSRKCRSGSPRLELKAGGGALPSRGGTRGRAELSEVPAIMAFWGAPLRGRSLSITHGGSRNCLGGGGGSRKPSKEVAASRGD